MDLPPKPVKRRGRPPINRNDPVSFTVPKTDKTLDGGHKIHGRRLISRLDNLKKIDFTDNTVFTSFHNSRDLILKLNAVNSDLQLFNTKHTNHIVPISGNYKRVNNPISFDIDQQTEDQQQQKTTLTKIIGQQTMPDFITETTWPTSVNIRCNWCSLPFTGKPWAIPRMIDDSGRIYIEDCFCSINCAYADLYYGNDQFKWEKIQNLYYLCKILTGEYPKTKIIPSPKKKVLIEYGGTITRQEYRNIISNFGNPTLENIVTVNIPPIIKMSPQIDNDCSEFGGQQSMKMSILERHLPAQQDAPESTTHRVEPTINKNLASIIKIV